MKLILKRQFNNSGSSLILVIVALAFVGILGTLILTLTMQNVQMKYIDGYSKDNFYSAEKSLDEIKVGLEEVVAKQMELAYINFLSTYTSTDTQEEKQKKVREEFIKGILVELGGSESATSFVPAKISKYLSNDSVLKNAFNIQITVDNVNYTYLTIKDVEIIETNLITGYETLIKTDISISSPSLQGTTGANGRYPLFMDFALIADKKLEVTNAATGIVVDGNIYVGEELGTLQVNRKTADVGGIVVSGLSDLTIKGGNKVISRSDLIIENGAKVVIGEPTIDTTLWIKNIRTKATTSSLGAELNMNGISYVADNMTLDASNSKIVMAGEYYGYSYNKDNSQASVAERDSQSSSGIVINGKGSSIDFSNIKTLVLGGNSYISRKQAEQSFGVNDILMGESISVKKNQIAYLVPSKYMHSGHNPMMESEVMEYEGSGSLNYTPIISFKEADGTEAFIAKYLNITHPYQSIIQPFSTGAGSIRYYYLNFKDIQSAKAYFEEYYLPNNIETINKNLLEYATGGIKISDDFSGGRLFIASNGLTYDPITDTSKSIVSTVEGNFNSDIPAQYMLDEANFYSKKYQSLRQQLTESETLSVTEIDTNSVFDTLISRNNIEADDLNNLGFYEAIDSNNIGLKINEIQPLVDKDYMIYVVNNYGKAPFKVHDGIKDGIVVATGDVSVENDYKGLIISAATISFKQVNHKVIADPGIINAIISSDNFYFKRYFITYGSSSIDIKLDFKESNISDQVQFENWRKAE